MEPTSDVATTWLDVLNRHGLAAALLVAFIVMAYLSLRYALDRLLNKDDGIVTNYGRAVEQSHQKLAESYIRLEQTDDKMGQLLKGQTAQLNDIEVHVIHTGEQADKQEDVTKAVLRIANKGCDIVERATAGMPEHDKIVADLSDIRSELRKHT